MCAVLVVIHFGVMLLSPYKIPEQTRNMPKSIPEKWLEYKPFGKVINGTKILPFKVPLKEIVCNNLEPDKRFTTSMLVQAFPHVKYIVDLTNTGRYYDEKEFTSYGVQYKKIMVPGREVPSMNLVEKFFKLMDDFTSACGEEDIVGVHCTHGINRTGYFICRYLVQQLGWDLEDCLKAFTEARGYPIEREMYLNALKKTPRDKKIDTSTIRLESFPVSRTKTFKRVKNSVFKRPRHRPVNDTMLLPGFVSLRRGFANDGPSSPQHHFGFGGPPPGFRPMPPIPPLPVPPPMYPPRPFRYRPPLHPTMPPPPPRSWFPMPGFPPPGPNRTCGGTRLSPGPPSRLPPTMPPPPPAPARPVSLKQKTIRNPLGNLRRGNNQMTRVLSKLFKEQDFTVDTFEENLLAVSSQPHRRLTKGRYNQSK
ncbi:uncharacterized protein LOC143143250 [Ptiloglossa arizonensis]|uniref:uncharacterized protein LOC143143250 n=1 Tax=Ptiloglossa arizonensis TaxID=3350558 RepID=UPI003F9F4B1D